MEESNQYEMAGKAMKRHYPSWHIFIDEMMDSFKPFWLGTQSQEKVHSIHLIGYGNRQKVREMMTDLLELLDCTNVDGNLI